MQSFTSDIQFICPKCNRPNQQTVPVPELNFMAEKTRDMATDDQAELECEHCETVFSGWVYVDPGSAFFQMEEPIAFEFHGDMPMYGPDYDDYIPDDPHSIAQESLSTLNAMIGKSPAPQGDPQFPNRLIFAGSIIALEAYLTDTLLSAVRDNDTVFKSLVTKNVKLKIISLPLEQLVTQPDLLKTTVLRHLSGLMYHNLSVVTALYKDAFDFNILPDEGPRNRLYSDTLLRHDCVHRNGFDKDGNKATTFTDAYIAETINVISTLINFIEKETGKVLYPDDGTMPF